MGGREREGGRKGGREGESLCVSRCACLRAHRKRCSPFGGKQLRLGPAPPRAASPRFSFS